MNIYVSRVPQIFKALFLPYGEELNSLCIEFKEFYSTFCCLRLKKDMSDDKKITEIWVHN